MSKRFFSFLLILMGFSILGVIAVQMVWINNAIRVKNELFDRSINDALNNTASRLELQHDVEVIAGFPSSHIMKWNRQNQPIPPPPPKPVRIIRDLKTPGNMQFEFEVETDSDVRVFTMTSDTDSTFTHEIIVHGSDTIHTNTHALITSNQFHLDSIEMAIDSLIDLSPDVKSRFEVKTKKLKHLSNQVVAEITAIGTSEIELDDLRKVVQTELDDKDIKIEFELALLENDTIQALSSQPDSLSLIKSNYQVRLFPNAIFVQNKKLSLFFPGQDRYIYHSVSWLLIASFFFSMVILMTFALSIFFILKQKKISEMKSDFINNMTHEFKTPIATISVAADSISNEKVIDQPEQINYFVNMIKKENARMNQQVEDILTIARLDKKDFEFHWETLNVHQIIDEAIQSIILQIEKRGGQIDLQLQATNPMVTTDKNHCINIIFNLLDNANKYSAENPHITIATKNISKGILISVIDQGKGMSKQVQTHIFERFYRQPSGNIHNVKGFGLGLSYVKAILEANQGSINVHSEPNKGSRFEVFLPFLRE